MNEVLKTIRERRSTRGFKSEAVPQELIETIAEAGLYAPNGGGRQDTLTLVITDPALIARLSKMNAKYGLWNIGREFDPLYNAPVVMVVFGKRESNTCVEDGSLIIGTMLLAAESLGLDGIWVHRAFEEFESDEGKAILKELGIADEYRAVGHCLIGYAAEEAKPAAPRKENRIVYAKK